MGMAGDMFAAALIGLGVPEQELVQVLETTGEPLGLLDVHTHLEFLPDDTLARRLHITAVGEREPLLPQDGPVHLERALAQMGVGGEYASFARRALTALVSAWTSTSGAGVDSPQRTVSLPVVGIAHTPYQHQAPYQPTADGVESDAFYIELEPEYRKGLAGLETFSHIFVISYLDRTRYPEMTVRPPWRDGPERYGLFATRSPNRPSPIGLTRTPLRRIEGNRLYTGQLDLFDGTPVLDLKPFVRSLDGTDEGGPGNDGWLEGSEHLELHRRGIPHTHPGHSYQIEDAIAELTASAWGLQWLGVDMEEVRCLVPVHVGGAVAPATQAILEQHRIPSAPGPAEAELLTAAGAAILAALSPTFVPRVEAALDGLRLGVGLGRHSSDQRPHALRLYVTLPNPAVETDKQEGS